MSDLPKARTSGVIKDWGYCSDNPVKDTVHDCSCASNFALAPVVAKFRDKVHLGKESGQPYHVASS